MQLFQYDALNGADWIAKTADQAPAGRKAVAEGHAGPCGACMARALRGGRRLVAGEATKGYRVVSAVRFFSSREAARGMRASSQTASHSTSFDVKIWP